MDQIRASEDARGRRAVQSGGTGDGSTDRKLRSRDTRESHLYGVEAEPQVVHLHATARLEHPYVPRGYQATRAIARGVEVNVGVDVHVGERARENGVAAERAARGDLEAGDELLYRRRADVVEAEIGVVQTETAFARHGDAYLPFHRSAIQRELGARHHEVAHALGAVAHLQLRGPAARVGEGGVEPAHVGERERASAGVQVHVTRCEHVRAAQLEPRAGERSGHVAEPERVGAHAEVSLETPDLGARRREREGEHPKLANAEEPDGGIGIGEAYVRKRGLDLLEIHHRLIPARHLYHV
jgi:hypothetical protein